MKSALFLAAAAAAFALPGAVNAQVWTFEPVSDTVWIKGNTELVSWRNDVEKGPGIETIDIELGTGGSNRVTILETIVKGLPYPATTNYTWTIPSASKYKQQGQVYCLHYVGRGKNLTKGGVETPIDGWSTWFALVDDEATYSRFLNLPTTSAKPTTTADEAAAPTSTTTLTTTSTSSAGPVGNKSPATSAGGRIEAVSAMLGLATVLGVVLGVGLF